LPAHHSPVSPFRSALPTFLFPCLCQNQVPATCF
jgi:hypothetical protein